MIDADPRPRWAAIEREYGADPETTLEILDERWRLADGDHRERRSVARRAIEWLLRELDACIRVGAAHVVAEADSPADASRPMADLFVLRISEYLRRAVAMAERCEPALSLETAAAVGVVVGKFAPALRSPWSVSMHVENLRAARDVLREAIAADDATFSALPEPVEPGPADPDPEPDATTATAGKRNKGKGGRPKDKDGPNEKRIFQAAQADARADLYDIARRFNTSHAEVVRIVGKHAKRAKRAASRNTPQ